MDLKIDYRNVDWADLQVLNIFLKDLAMFFSSDSLKIVDFRDQGFTYAIAYVNEQKMIHITYIVSESDEFHVELLQVGRPNGEDIKKYWCG